MLLRLVLVGLRVAVRPRRLPARYLPARLLRGVGLRPPGLTPRLPYEEVAHQVGVETAAELRR
ncbi:hypothetical protein I3W98_37720, partial [Streptomyces cavourensis]|nr:hypothetical protein [Streptomyces cavourensis]